MTVKNLVHALSLPLWDGDVQQEQLTFVLTGVQNPTIPAGATAVLMSSLQTGSNEFFVSPVTTNPSGLRVGGPSANSLLFRLGPGATFEIRGNTGSSEVFGLAYFFGQPPAGGAGGNASALDVPVWDNRIEHEEFSLTPGGTSKMTIPATAKWFGVGCPIVATPNEALLSISATNPSGIKFGGNTGVPIIHRISQPELARGRATAADAVGNTLTDANATFLSDGIVADDTITNMTDGVSRGRVVTVDSDTQITCVALAGGDNDDWDVGDLYTIRQTPAMHLHNLDGGTAVPVGALYFAE
jgi:hypothetical protein